MHEKSSRKSQRDKRLKLSRQRTRSYYFDLRNATKSAPSRAFSWIHPCGDMAKAPPTTCLLVYKERRPLHLTALFRVRLGRSRFSSSGCRLCLKMSGPISQDWEPVVIRKKPVTAGQRRDEKAVNEARRAGGPIETIKKFNAGSNKPATSTPGINTKKLDEETEVLAHERVPTDLKKNIIQARMDKKMTQAQLAQLINEKPQVIQEYESGKAIPNQQIIAKLERVLGTKLRSGTSGTSGTSKK